VSEKGFAATDEKCLFYQLQNGEIRLAEKVNIFGRTIHRRMSTKSRTALYMRVSTADQKPDLQFDDLRAYAERASLEIVREYLDVAVSGRKQGRLQLDALTQGARSRVRLRPGLEIRPLRPPHQAPAHSTGGVRSPGHSFR
jgi:hypothetical protein